MTRTEVKVIFLAIISVLWLSLYLQNRPYFGEMASYPNGEEKLTFADTSLDDITFVLPAKPEAEGYILAYDKDIDTFGWALSSDGDITISGTLIADDSIDDVSIDWGRGD